MYERITETPFIHETVLNSLLEQARQEGVAPLEARSNNESPIHSYYQEALDIIRSNSVNHLDNANVNADYEDANDSQQLNLKSVSLKTRHSMGADINQSDLDYSASDSKTKRLPKLYNKMNESSMDEGRASSAMSNTSSVSASFFPKIESRFLPKSNN